MNSKLGAFIRRHGDLGYCFTRPIDVHAWHGCDRQKNKLMQDRHWSNRNIGILMQGNLYLKLTIRLMLAALLWTTETTV